MTYNLPQGWECASCPLCGSDDAGVVCTSRDWALGLTERLQIVRCRHCGMAYTNPRPGVAEIGRYYPKDYALYRHRHAGGGPGGIRGAMLRWAWGAPALRPSRGVAATLRLLSLVRKPASFGFGVPFQGQGRLMDFGCGGGEFLRRMAWLGWTVTGVDFSQDAVDLVRAAGFEACHGSLPHPELAGRRFDVITMRMSLEHVHDPLATVRAAAEMLDIGGKLVIIVPNFGSWDRTHFGEAWYALDLPRHLTHFEKHTLQGLLERVGLRVEHLHSEGDDGILRKSLALQRQRVGPGIPVRSVLDRILSIKPLLKLFARYLTWRDRGIDLVGVARKGSRD